MSDGLSPVASVEVVCAVNACGEPPVDDSGVLCFRHYELVGQLIPDRLDKKPGYGTLVCGHLTGEELDAIAAQVERDAVPLFLAAWNWCGIQSLRKIKILPGPVV